MKNIKNTFNKMLKIFIIVLTLTSTATLTAQTGFGDDVDDTGGGGIPLDGGLSLLIAGAAVYGIKKLREHKNE